MPDDPAGRGVQGPETPSQPARSRCSVCGSEEVEILAWVLMNGETYVDDAEPHDNWCPTCEKHFVETCLVDSQGHCLNHERSVDLCEKEFRRRAAP